jgi:DNA repair protein SbcD/Mre11
MRFLHLADVHLDTLFAGRSEDIRRRLRDASREALRRGFERARRERVDAVLVAGDLLDGTRLSLATERFLGSEVAALAEAGIPLVYATGNHDPGTLFGAGSGTHGRLPWLDRVHLLDGPEPRTIPVHREERLVGTVTGAGHAADREERDLSRSLRPPGGSGVPAVALLHTQVGGAGGQESHDRYAPSDLAFLRAAGFDYWALGHIHLRQVLETFPGIHYPGNVQGRSPREQGAKGGLLVNLPEPGTPPRVTFLDLAPIRWETIIAADLHDSVHVEALVRRIVERWERARTPDPGLPGTEWMIRVELQGPCPLHGLLRDAEERAALADDLALRLGALEVEVRTGGLRAALDLAPALERQDAAGAALRLLRSLAAGGGPSPSEVLGIEAGDLAGHPELDTRDRAAVDAYLRSLLEGGDLELLERFREGGSTP